MRSKLTEEVIKDIAKKLRVGNYMKTVAISIGVSERTFYYWVDRGEKANKLAEAGQKVPIEEKIYLQFLQSIRQAEAEAEIVIVAQIFSQIPKDWKAGLELLARKYPERWARKDYVDFRGSIDQGPDKRQEALNEFEDMFKDVPRAKLAAIIQDTNKRLNEAKNEFLMKKELKNKQLQAPD